VTFLPPPKEFVFTSVWCFHFSLFVCMSVCPSDNWKSCERIFTKFLGEVGHGPGTKGINFGDDPDHHQDPGVRSPKSGFTALSKKLPTDFDEILWRAGVRPRDQLITFWWWPATLSGFRSLFRITIRIREELASVFQVMDYYLVLVFILLWLFSFRFSFSYEKSYFFVFVFI